MLRMVDGVAERGGEAHGKHTLNPGCVECLLYCVAGAACIYPRNPAQGFVSWGQLHLCAGEMCRPLSACT